ncbi:MAG: ABC transporter ATP-binding protein [Acidobacteriota bacterium]|jgi:putative ABC transport system ATP-binding protein|nr:ABC transporter ATP-binding protein [Acidobacteriota bacterium]
MSSEGMILRLQDVSRIYQQGQEIVRALDNVTLSLGKGEFVAIAGPSGSGKTTLLNVAVGLDRPTEGKVWIRDHDLNSMNAHELARLRLEEVGFIFQSYNLVPVLNAEENAELILLLRGVPRHQRKTAVRQILEEVGLAGLEKRRPSELSGGQQQRVAVARAIAAEPALVLADEPTANLDSETALALLKLMEKLNREHETTFLFSTHDPRVMKRAHRIIHLVDGRVDRDEPQVHDG